MGGDGLMLHYNLSGQFPSSIFLAHRQQNVHGFHTALACGGSVSPPRECCLILLRVSLAVATQWTACTRSYYQQCRSVSKFRSAVSTTLTTAVALPKTRGPPTRAAFHGWWPTLVEATSPGHPKWCGFFWLSRSPATQNRTIGHARGT